MFRIFYPVRSLDEEHLAEIAGVLARLDAEAADGDGAGGEEPGGDASALTGTAAEFLALGRAHGEGFVADGFVRLVDPVRMAPLLPREALAALLGQTTPLDRVVTVAVTAFGDLILAVPGDGEEDWPRMLDVMGRHGSVVDLSREGHPEVADLVGLFEGAPGRNALLRTENYSELVGALGLPGLDAALVAGPEPDTGRIVPLAEAWAAWPTDDDEAEAEPGGADAGDEADEGTACK